MQPRTVNVVGDGAAHKLSDIAGIGLNACKWFQFLNSGASLRLGDANTDSSHGYPIGSQSANFSPPLAQSMELYDLTTWYYYMDNADTAVLLCVY